MAFPPQSHQFVFSAVHTLFSRVFSYAFGVASLRFVVVCPSFVVQMSLSPVVVLTPRGVIFPRAISFVFSGGSHSLRIGPLRFFVVVAASFKCRSSVVAYDDVHFFLGCFIAGFATSQIAIQWSMTIPVFGKSNQLLLLWLLLLHPTPPCGHGICHVASPRPR